MVVASSVHEFLKIHEVILKIGSMLWHQLVKVGKETSKLSLCFRQKFLKVPKIFCFRGNLIAKPFQREQWERKKEREKSWNCERRKKRNFSEKQKVVARQKKDESWVSWRDYELGEIKTKEERREIIKIEEVTRQIEKNERKRDKRKRSRKRETNQVLHPTGIKPMTFYTRDLLFYRCAMEPLAYFLVC